MTTGNFKVNSFEGRLYLNDLCRAISTSRSSVIILWVVLSITLAESFVYIVVHSQTSYKEFFSV